MGNSFVWDSVNEGFTFEKQMSNNVPVFDYETGSYDGIITLDYKFNIQDRAVWTPEYGLLIFHSMKQDNQPAKNKVENPVPNPGQTSVTVPDMPNQKSSFWMSGSFYRDGKVYIASNNGLLDGAEKVGYLLILDLSTLQWSSIAMPKVNGDMGNYLLPW